MVFSALLFVLFYCSYTSQTKFCLYMCVRGLRLTVPPPQNLQIANLKNDYDLRKILDFLSV